MSKKVELPFYGFYGLDATPYRYFFLREDSENVEKYKKDILKVLKYEVLRDIFPEYKTGNSTYDSEHLRITGNTQKVQLDSNKIALFYGESVQGVRGGELIVTYEFDENQKDVKLNIYDRNTKVDIVREGDEKGQYAVCDTITQSQLTLKNGKKIHPNDINICSSLTGIGTREAYSYDAAIKVFEEVKAKLDYEMDDPRDYITEEKENKKENTNNVKR